MIGITAITVKKNRARQGDPAHRVVQIAARRLAGTHTGHVTAVLLETSASAIHLNWVAVQKYEKNKIIKV